jgi:hypothetical protein
VKPSLVLRQRFVHLGRQLSNVPIAERISVVISLLALAVSLVVGYRQFFYARNDVRLAVIEAGGDSILTADLAFINAGTH